jgi:hypothetical protein
VLTLDKDKNHLFVKEPTFQDDSVQKFDARSQNREEEKEGEKQGGRKRRFKSAL